MVLVTAVAFVVGAVCLYYGMRALRTRAAVRRLDANRERRRNPAEWLDPTDGETPSADETPGDHRHERRDVAVERGVVLLVLGLLCVLFGLFAL